MVPSIVFMKMFGSTISTQVQKVPGASTAWYMEITGSEVSPAPERNSCIRGASEKNVWKLSSLGHSSMTTNSFSPRRIR